MTQECSESSVAISPATPPGGGWWDLHYHHHASSLSSCWTNNTTSSPWHHQQQPNPSSNSSCEDVSMCTSFTNSGLTVESSSRRRLIEPATASSPTELMGEHASDTQLWSHIVLGVGSNGEPQNSQDAGENLLEALSSKSISSGIFEPACDYLKKLDSNWEFTNNPSLNNFDKHMNSFSTASDHHHHHHHHHHHPGLIENERVTKLSNLVSNWSIAPPDPGLVNSNCEFDPITCNISLNNSSINHFSHDQPQNFSDSSTCATTGGMNSRVSGFSGHGLKVENVETLPAEYVMRRSFGGSNINGGGGYNFGLNYGVAPGDNNTCTSERNFTDGINFNVRLNKPLIDVHQGHKPSFKSLTLSDCRKQGLQSSLRTGRGQGITNEGKKKRSDDDNSETIVIKKPKQETSTASSVKMQAPKVKLGDRITALQQIVSPFGKTDTASVLLEAIQYIMFLQEQVQLINNAHNKDPWGVGLEKKEKLGDIKVDLKSKGLCLVPISCTPQVYHENTGSDYWTPTYRGCLYR